MEGETSSNSVIDLKMATEDHYKERAAFYRSSAEYNKMIENYPILHTSIENCRNEKLIA